MIANDVFECVPGVRLAAVGAGIKYADRNDLVLIEVPEEASCAAVFTRNAFCAAPVVVAREHLQAGSIRYLLINSGNANAGTGAQGMVDARASCHAVAATAGCAPEQVLPFSTGVIGANLPLDKITAAIPRAWEALSESGWDAASKAIMTTDTVPKLVFRRVEIGGKMGIVAGMAKGSGMIRPDMATMLAYLATDLKVDSALLQQVLEQAVAPSFNSITVDGDTSTNDSCVLLASGMSGIALIKTAEGDAYDAFLQAVSEVCMELATAIVRDGEGATKLVTIDVEQALSEDEARDVAYTIAHSPLVKTALFASDPNWGRILAAVGRAGVKDMDLDRIEIWLDDVCIVRGGGRSTEYTEAAGQRVFSKPEFVIRVVMGRGQARARVLTCDLSYDYVKINAEYRT